MCSLRFCISNELLGVSEAAGERITFEGLGSDAGFPNLSAVDLGPNHSLRWGRPEHYRMLTNISHLTPPAASRIPQL